METRAEHRHPARLEMAVFAVKASLLRKRCGLAPGQYRLLDLYPEA
jgi:hypothetical protein